MRKQGLLDDIVTSRKGFSLAFALLFNAFTWFYMILVMMASLPSSLSFLSTFRGVFSIATIGSSVAGALFAQRVSRVHFIYFWMLLGAVSSFLLVYVPSMATGYQSFVFLTLGVSFGLGMPSSMAYLADNTIIENRGRVSALIFLAANLSAAPLAVLLTSLSFAGSATIFALWRMAGLGAFLVLRPSRTLLENNVTKPVSFMSTLHDRRFVLYIVPWSMFNLIDILEKSVLEGYSQTFPGPRFSQLVVTAEPIIASFSILIGGLLADRIGRKRVVIYGFVSLGVAYAIIGMAPFLLIAWYVYMVIDGLAAGILWIVFILILWGDLSQVGGREKYYAVGSLPFFASSIVPLFIVPMVGLVPPAAAFSVASFFLFLAVLPLMYAPETLPDKKIELRRMKGYIEQAKKERDKFTEKRSVEKN